MTPERWGQLEELYQAARALPASERAALLERADPELRATVTSLLAQEGLAQEGVLENGDAPREDGAFLDRPAWEGRESLLKHDGPLQAGAPVLVGQQLGPYRIEQKIGEGGMGTVYRATDTRLGRPVAIKISRSVLDGRFEREARAISSLNHPHICTLYDIGPDYMVMELVEGETMAARIRKSALPISEVLRYGAQIAGALAAAHAKNVTHRDLKPANVMIAKNGVKVLDFGLAKCSTRDRTLTLTGAVMGTPAYMAPEQLEGKEADTRTDIFALGHTLYEMATAKRIVPGQPPILLEGLPERVAHVIDRCLEHDPENRWQSARDAEFELQWAGAKSGPSTAERTTSRLPWVTAGAALLLAAALGYLVWQRSREPVALTTSLAISPPPGATMRQGLAISPDARSVVFAARLSGTDQLWLRPLDSLTPRELPGTEEAAFPFWSPDSRFVGFFSHGKLRKIEIKSGAVSVVCDVGQGRGGTWSEDGVILFNSVNDGPILRVAAAGGVPVPVTTVNSAGSENSHRFPEFLPGGRQFLYFNRAQNPEISGMYLAPLDRPQGGKRILGSRVAAHFIPARNGVPALLLWVDNGNLLAQRFDLNRTELIGDPTPLAQDVRGDPDFGRYAQISAARDGTIVYERAEGANAQAIWMNRNGKPSGSAGPPDSYTGVRLSPDDHLAALPRVAAAGHPGGITFLDFARDTIAPVIDGFWGAWSPDSQTIAYASSPGGPPKIYATPIHNKNPSGPLTSGHGSQEVLDWSADGRFILYSEQSNELNAANSSELRAMSLPGGQTSLVAVGLLDDGSGRFSRDSKWVAYATRESGRYEVRVKSFPEGKGGWQVSGNGGRQPLWRKDGGELFYLAADQTLMSVAVRSSAGGLEFGSPTALFKIPVPARLGQGVAYPYDVASDGRILILSPAGNADADAVVVLSNWQSELPFAAR